MAVADWPLINDVGGEFYFKPDAGRLPVSPADATPSPPVDARPEEEDLAIGVARLEAVTTLEVRRLTHKWAGLRSFVADGSPVAGFDEELEGFFWLAGQGGYGIKTAPALARATASLIDGKGLPADLAERGLREQDLAPARCRTATPISVT
jgi:D-arginine dehydrogenase